MAFTKWEDLTISDDFLFSKLMRDKEVCKKVIEVLLKFRVKDIVYLEEEKSIDLELGSKSVRLDVYVEDGDKVYNIEMQVADTKNLPKRSRYYQGMIDLHTIEKGEIYNNLKETYVVFICMFDPFNEGLPKYTFRHYGFAIARATLYSDFVAVPDGDGSETGFRLCELRSRALHALVSNGIVLKTFAMKKPI